MSLMNWDLQKFDVLVPDMNKQHEHLIAIMNRLYDRADAKAPKAELNRILIELRDYTVKHFQDEEAYMQKVGFPQFENHKRIHQKLVQDFVRYYEEFAAGPGELPSAFFNFLRLWLTSHIMHIDHRYGEFSQH